MKNGGIPTIEERRTYAFRLSEEDFDEAGDMNYFNKSVFQRGPLGKTESYTQPSNEWYRIGLKVREKYPESHTIWLAMDNNPGEWYVAYHGIRIGDNKVMHQVVSNVMNGGLIEGWAQAY